MRRGKITWIVVSIAALIVSFVLLYPTFEFYSMSQQEQLNLRQSDPAKYYSLKARALRLGLDLQGGVHMVLQVKDPRGGEGVATRARRGAFPARVPRARLRRSPGSVPSRVLAYRVPGV